MDKQKPIKIKLKHPDLSGAKPPTKSAAEIMVENLRATKKTVK